MKVRRTNIGYPVGITELILYVIKQCFDLHIVINPELCDQSLGFSLFLSFVESSCDFKVRIIFISQYSL